MNEHAAKRKTAVGTPVSLPDSPGRGWALHRCIVSRYPLGAQGLETAYLSDGVMRDAVHDLADAGRVPAARRSGFYSTVILYGDFEQDIAPIHLLRRLRNRSPNLPVVLISEKVPTSGLT